MIVNIPGFIEARKRDGGLAIIAVASISSVEEVFDDRMQPLCVRVYTSVQAYEVHESMEVLTKRMGMALDGTRFANRLLA
jgi:hypothetical protein